MFGSHMIHAGHLLVPPCPTVSAHEPGQQPQPEKDLITKRADPMGVKVCVMPPSKPLIPAKLRAGGYLEWTMEEEEEIQL